MSAIEPTVDQSQYLSFYLAGEEYAVAVLKVKEIIEYCGVTRVPRTPQFICGVINLRGSVVPVIDLAVKFGLPESTLTKWTCIVIVEVDLEGEQTVMGIMADSVNQVIDLLPEDIEAAPSFGTPVQIDYLLGMGKAGKKFVLILDIDRVLSTNEMQTAVSLQPPEPEDMSQLDNEEFPDSPAEEFSPQQDSAMGEEEVSLL
jgi:purine-binding chemotaxis protein CheW